VRIKRFVAWLVLLATVALVPSTALAAGVSARTTGGGWFLFGGSIPMQFSFSGIQHADGSASGSFHHAYTDDVGSYQFFGTVTCLAFDPVHGRAWIGGVLTEVISNDPDVGLAAGDDAWFRVLDSPAGDRSTAMGFVGAIESSEAYCAMQIWPEGDARTHPVTSGQIKVQAD
jgi:hypothetical protein